MRGYGPDGINRAHTRYIFVGGVGCLGSAVQLRARSLLLFKVCYWPLVAAAAEEGMWDSKAAPSAPAAAVVLKAVLMAVGVGVGVSVGLCVCLDDVLVSFENLLLRLYIQSLPRIVVFIFISIIPCICRQQSKMHCLFLSV